MRIFTMFLAIFLTTSVVGIAFGQELPAFSQEEQQLVEEQTAQMTAPMLLTVQAEVPAEDPKVEPVLIVVKYAVEAINKLFPKAGPTIQLILEVIASIGTLFTLLTVFAVGLLKIPLVIARVGKAHELADKIQAFHDKWIPILKKLSIFNAPPTAKKK